MLLLLPSTSNGFGVTHVPLRRSLWCGVGRKDQSLGIAVSVLKLSWSVPVQHLLTEGDDPNFFM